MNHQLTTTPGWSNEDIIRHAKEAEARITPEQKQARRQRGLLGIKLSDAPTFSGNEKICNCIKGVFYDVRDMGECNPENLDIRIWRINEHLMFRCIDATPDEPQFHKYLQNIYKMVCVQHDKLSADTAARVQADQDYIKHRKNTLKFVENELSEMRKDQVIAQESKALRQFSDAEQEKMINVMSYSLEDLERSRDNVTENKTKLLAKIRDIDKAVNKLEAQCEPYNSEISELTTRQQVDDIDEPTFKDLDSSIHFRESKLNKLRAKIEKLQKEKADLQTELETIQKKEDIVNCALDRQHLLREIGNWQNRKQRAVERIMRVLKDRDGLSQLRTNLNLKWKQLTNDQQDLCQDLCLKADSRIYFI